MAVEQMEVEWSKRRVLLVDGILATATPNGNITQVMKKPIDQSGGLYRMMNRCFNAEIIAGLIH